MKSRLLLIAVALMSVLVMGSCHSSRKTMRGSHGQTVVTGSTRESVDRDIAGSLIECARRWLGTPYRYGGNDRKGIDCSGLTCNVFEHVADIRLPRDSRSQSRYCLRVDRRDIQPGDLVFFVNKPGGDRINHVGLYIGAGRMIHASSSRGVTESSITDGYWRDRYYCGGRVEAITYAARRKSPPKGTPAPDDMPPQDVPTINLADLAPALTPAVRPAASAPVLGVASPLMPFIPASTATEADRPEIKHVEPATETEQPDSVMPSWLE
ncbi:MAG: NlpC/P60 family protein [Bacteroidales bacterium]|nr:NlpC/P60 family protein [Bacteroidales bacterium]